jgi:hypothetical protein
VLLPERSSDARVRRGPLLVALAALVVLGVGFGAFFVRNLTRDVPEFASLAKTPDPSLRGTVAYFSDRTRCVRIVAAAGAPAKDVLCLTGQDVAKAVKLGKELGPQLVWLDDGRLEITMFRMTTPPGPGFNAGWQKIVDVRTGAVVDVPEADAPAEPNLATRPTVDPDGRRIVATSDEDSGRIKVQLSDAQGTRTLLSAQGPPNHSYRLSAAFWSPDGQWVAADDGRILIVTTGTPSVTRVLTDDTTQFGFGGDDPRISRFAVTAADLLGVGR